MVEVNVSTLDDARAEMVQMLRDRGFDAEHYHSGGGVMGVKIASSIPAGQAYAFTTLSNEDEHGNANWILLDLHNHRGDFFATVELEIVAYGPSYDPVATLDALVDLANILDGTP